MPRKKSPREDMEEDGRLDDTAHITRIMARQLITAYQETYDKEAVAIIEQLRKRSKSTFAKRQCQKFDEYTELVEELSEKFDIPVIIHDGSSDVFISHKDADKHYDF
jgi:esterase/lipase